MMKKIFRTLAITVVLAISPLAALAQYDVETTVRADLVSKYMWRGLEKGGISLQPSAKVSWMGAYFSFFGNTGFERNDPEELDLTLGYKAPFGLNVGVTDYWETGITKYDLYFQYKKAETAHRLEGNLGYSCKYFSLQGYCIFWGNDRKRSDNKQAYSTYIELTVPFELGGLDWQIQGGFTPMESGAHQKVFDESDEDYGMWYYTYANGAACVNASLKASKELSFRKFSVPIYAVISSNPYMKTAQILAGVAFKFDNF
jgi:hypothetical protein